MSILGRAYQLIDFQMQNIVVPVLPVLDQKYHEEGDDGGRRVDDQLPSVFVMKIRPGHGPYEDLGNSGQ